VLQDESVNGGFHPSPHFNFFKNYDRGLPIGDPKQDLKDGSGPGDLTFAVVFLTVR